jgi:hypothetical protein
VEFQHDSIKALSRSVTQQLQSNGLLRQLPDVLQAAAELLQQLPVPDTGAAVAEATGAQHRNLLATLDTLMALAPGLAVFQHSQTDLLHTMDAGAHLALAFMQHLTSHLAAVPAGPAPMHAGGYTAAAENCIHLLGEWVTHAVQNTSSLQRPSTAAAAVSVLGLVYYAQSLLPDALTAQVASLAHSSSSRISNSAGSPGAVAVAAAAPAHVASHAREWPEQFGLLHWLKKAKQQQQQDVLLDLAADAADPCFVITGGVSMQAAAWVGSCNFGRLQRKFVDVIRAAGVVQQRCWDEVSQLTGQQQQQQQPQGGIPWLTLLNSAPTLQPIKCLLLAQLLLCSVDRFCSNGAATLNMLAAYASQAAELAANKVSFTMAHQKGVQQDHFCLLRDWLVTVLPATLQLLAHAVQLLDKGRRNPAGSSNSSSGGSSSSKQREQQQEKAVVLRPLQLLLNLALLTCRPNPVATAAVRSGQDGSTSGAAPGAESADEETGEAPAPFPYYTAPAWNTHIAELSRVLEGLLRVLGRRPVTDFTAAVANMVSGLIFPPSGLSAVRLAFLCNFRAACPGCLTQLQVFSMLCSLLKVGSVVRQVDEAAADAVCWGTANVATLLGAESLAKVPVAAAAASAAAAPSSTKPVEELHHVVRSPAQPSAAASGGLLFAGAGRPLLPAVGCSTEAAAGQE